MAPTPMEQLLQMHFAFAPPRILKTALELNLFGHLAGGGTVSEVARRAQASERGIRMVLDALTGFQLLVKSNGSYHMAPIAEQFLLPESPSYIGEFLAMDDLWKSWSGLTEIVRTGMPAATVHSQETAEEFFPKLVRGLHVVNREPARRAAQVLGAGGRLHGLRVVDIGCGSGVWGIAIAEADAEARVTAQDYPGVLEHTRDYLRRHGVLDRYDFLPGSLREVDFGEGRYDLALLGNIVHGEGEASSRDLFHRLHRALRPGGQIAVADMIPNDERTGPPYPLIFAVNMLVQTTSGDTFTLAEYTRWLKDAGFTRVETADIGSHSPLVVGHKG